MERLIEEITEIVERNTDEVSGRLKKFLFQRELKELLKHYDIVRV